MVAVSLKKIFFKQKTAYEIGSGDWSSDVCSSDLELCLKCYYAIMGYSYIPKESLGTFISCLCRVVNLGDFSAEAWRIMASLMATHLGHSALYNLCEVGRVTDGRLVWFFLDNLVSELSCFSITSKPFIISIFFPDHPFG